MGTKVSKQYISLDGKLILYRTIKKFDDNFNISEIIVVIKEEDSTFFKDEILNKFEFEKDIKFVFGGEERVDSIYNGLKVVSKDTDIVMIHDGVRPFVNKEIIDANIDIACKYGACLTAVRTKDTVKIVKDGFISETPDRDTVFLAQTPQTFKKEIILDSYRALGGKREGITDDCMIVEKAGYRVKVVEGNYENIKLTTPEDLFVGENILKGGDEK